MGQIIQIFQDVSSDHTQVIELDTVTITLRLKYNVRNASWFYSFTTENNEISDIKLVSNFPMLRQHKAIASDIPGDFFVIKTNDNAGDEITYDNLGTDYQLIYATADEVVNWFNTYNIEF
jgi:hypothetical protein